MAKLNSRDMYKSSSFWENREYFYVDITFYLNEKLFCEPIKETHRNGSKTSSLRKRVL
jgi:hypothetical protein